MTLKIFLFHRVSPLRDPLWDPLDPGTFDAIIRHLQKRYTLVQLEQALLPGQGKNLQKPHAAVVFDDGYKDFTDHALPVLKKYNCPSSMYVVTDCATQQLPPWTYILDYHFSESKKLQLQLDEALLPEQLRRKKFHTAAERIAYARQLKPYLKTIPDASRRKLYSQAVASLDDVQVPSGLMMSWDELRALKSEGVEIGSHTMTHPLLAKLGSEAEISAEIKGSGDIIRQQLGHFPVTLSYPIGSYDTRVKRIAAESGYKLGLAVDQDFYDSRRHDLFGIPRTELYNESLFKTKLRISGLIRQLNTLRR